MRENAAPKYRDVVIAPAGFVACSRSIAFKIRCHVSAPAVCCENRGGTRSDGRGFRSALPPPLVGV